MQIQRFIDEHADIMQLLGELESLSEGSIEYNANNLAKQLMRLHFKVKVHLSAEVAILQPILNQDTNRTIRVLAHDWRKQVTELRRTFLNYISQWGRASQILSAPDDFYQQTHHIIEVLRANIQREDNEFYPVIAKVQLHNVSQRVDKSADDVRLPQAINEATAAKLTKPEPVFDSCTCRSLYDIMSDMSRHPGVFLLETNLGSLYLDVQNRRFFANREQLQQLDHDGVQLLDVSGVATDTPANLLQKPVFYLAWHLTAQAESLVPWIDVNTQYRLKRWPRLNSLPNRNEVMMFCALMSRRPLSPTQLSKLDKEKVAILDHFLNTASVAGLLKAEKRAASEVNPVQQKNHNRFGTMIRGLRSRLGLST